MLAALMLSIMLLTTGLLLHAVAMNQPRPGTHPGSVSDRARLDHSREIVLTRGR